MGENGSFTNPSKKSLGWIKMGFNNGEFLCGDGGLAREPFKGLLTLRTSLSSRVVVSPKKKELN